MMENLQTLLRPGERVLWSHHRVVNYAIRLPLVACILGGFMIGFAVFYWYVPNWSTIQSNFMGIEIPGPVMYGIVIGLLYGFIGFAFCFAFLIFKKGKKERGTTSADLKHYPEFFALTDQRWIQKGLMRIGATDSSLFARGLLTREKDVLSLQLQSCERAVFRKYGYRWQISFYFKSVNPGMLSSSTTVIIPNKEIDALQASLGQLMTVVTVTGRESGLPLPTLHD